MREALEAAQFVDEPLVALLRREVRHVEHEDRGRLCVAIRHPQIGLGCRDDNSNTSSEHGKALSFVMRGLLARQPKQMSKPCISNYSTFK